MSERKTVAPTRLIAVLAAAAAALPVIASPPVTFPSLLNEMIDRDAVARLPDPAYTCAQFSSYDRASTEPGRLDAKGRDTWFANGDASQFLRVEDVPVVGGPEPSRKEWVMMDTPGPGAVVRIWSANPKGTLRVYLDGSSTPSIAAPMEQLLGGKWASGPITLGPPLSGERSRGWNLYLPVPYAKHCKITSDSDGFYYQVNYRTYEVGANVATFAPGDVDTNAELLTRVQGVLVAPGPQVDYTRHDAVTIEGGRDFAFPIAMGKGGAVAGIQLDVKADDLEQALRSTIVRLSFDGEETVWCPLGDFFGSGVGKNTFRTWYTGISGSGLLACWWVMPFEKSALLTIENTGTQLVRVQPYTRIKEWSWDDRSMHFRAAWNAEHPIHAYGGRGTRDWNYVHVKGQGVYVGDMLAVANPVPEWWGEGDEKIYVDGEKFPSHFGTGTEDYYGYAWCSPVPFTHPFHAQPRSDGNEHGNNWGHTTVLRVRSLDAIPFRASLKVDMEVWHWKECDEGYASTAWFYARPGATTNREPLRAAAAAPIVKLPPLPPVPPPFRAEGALECEGLTVHSKSDALNVGKQDMRGFARGVWSGEAHLWVQARRPGDFVELEVPAAGDKPVRVLLQATKSWDYGIVRASINGKAAASDIDLFSGQGGRCEPSGAIDLGVHTPKDGKLLLRVEVVGGNPAAQGTRAFFGVDYVLVKAP
ncbi:MAG: glycoside hydrolase family 172 protein [Phycisphaerales bacterium]